MIETSEIELVPLIWWKYVLLYENGNMRPVETIPGIGEGVNKNDDECEFNCEILKELL
jgi:hypothetical protein